MWVLRALRLLLLRTPSTWTPITPLQASHGILLLHLEVVLVLKPLLKSGCSLLLSHCRWVALSLLPWGTTGLWPRRGTS